MEFNVDRANSYFQYLELSQKSKLHQSIFAESPNCEKLLGMIALESEAGTPFTVSEVMRLEQLGSPCTIHRRMEALRKAGLIAQIQKSGDRRTKYLVPTRTASRYFKVMDHVIRNSIAKSQGSAA